MEAYVAFPSLKKETLAVFPLWRSYPCPGCLCRLLWVSGCGVQSESPGLMPEKRRSLTSVLWLTLSSGLLAFSSGDMDAFPGVTEQLASPTPEHQSVARDHWALSMPASQERSWIWVRGSPKVRTRYCWWPFSVLAAGWRHLSLGSLGPVLGGTCYSLIYGSNRNPQPQLQEYQTAIMRLIHARYQDDSINELIFLLVNFSLAGFRGNLPNLSGFASFSEFLRVLPPSEPGPTSPLLGRAC